ncbi:MAG: iron-sulfur cluster assembly accessory protein [Crenarchaeota archaeon]|nr:MAG: iron-sulfur cluster assembly accessory protein [Thermoproteota archaeon]
MSLNLTESAIKELKKFQEEQESGDYVRIAITSGGCSGFQYSMTLQSDPPDDKLDNILEFDGINVVVDKKSMLYLEGTTIDWIDDLNHRGFNFENPNAVRDCGCGKSFGV